MLSGPLLRALAMRSIQRHQLRWYQRCKAALQHSASEQTFVFLMGLVIVIAVCPSELRASRGDSWL